jgi:hypothetical protein
VESRRLLRVVSLRRGVWLGDGRTLYRFEVVAMVEETSVGY